MTRTDELDIAKGIGILLVIIGHVFPHDSVISIYIYTFHMPLFFIVSGMVLALKPQNKECFTLKWGGYGLISNYLLWSIIYFLFDVVIRFLLLHEYNVVQIVWRAYETIVLYGVNVLWFISTLFISKLLAGWFIRNITIIGRSKQISIISCIIVIWLFAGYLSSYIAVLNSGYLRLFFCLLSVVLRVLILFPFILVGFYGSRLFQKVKSCCLAKQIILFTTLLGVWVILAGYVGKVDIHEVKIGDNAFLTYFVAIVGSFAIIVISSIIKKLRHYKALVFLGVNSLLIMVTHEYLKLKKVIVYCLQPIEKSMSKNMFYVVETIVLVAIEVVLCYILAPYIQRLSDKIKTKIEKKLGCKSLG